MLTTFAVVRVIRSKDSKYSEGDILLNGYGLVAEYSIVPSSHIIRIIDPANGISLSDYLGSLGLFSLHFIFYGQDNINLSAFIIKIKNKKSFRFY